MNLEIVLVVILIVLLVALFAMSALKKKNFNTKLNTLRDELKVGDKVMTDSGIVGEVVDSYTEDEYKYFVLKSGKDKNTGFFTVHANAIYYCFNKDAQEKAEEKVVLKLKPKTEEKTEDNKAE